MSILFFSDHPTNCGNTFKIIWKLSGYLNTLWQTTNTQSTIALSHRNIPYICNINKYLQGCLCGCVWRAGCGAVKMHWGGWSRRRQMQWLVWLTQLFSHCMEESFCKQRSTVRWNKRGTEMLCSQAPRILPRINGWGKKWQGHETGLTAQETT